jgi:catechol-2,3-dioxygenase
MFNHLHLPVHDLERSVDFYCRWFQFVVEDKGAVFVKLRDAHRFLLILEQKANAEPLPVPFHFGFESPTNEDLRRRYDDLQSAGISIVQALQCQQDLFSFRCSDPTGHIIEVYRFQQAQLSSAH